MSQVVYIKTQNDDDGDDFGESGEEGDEEYDDDDDDGSDDEVVDELNVASVLGRDYKLNRKRVHVETPKPAFRTRSSNRQSSQEKLRRAKRRRRRGKRRRRRSRSPSSRWRTCSGWAPKIWTRRRRLIRSSRSTSRWARSSSPAEGERIPI